MRRRGIADLAGFKRDVAAVLEKHGVVMVEDDGMWCWHHPYRDAYYVAFHPPYPATWGLKEKADPQKEPARPHQCEEECCLPK